MMNALAGQREDGEDEEKKSVDPLLASESYGSSRKTVQKNVQSDQEILPQRPQV